MLQQTIMIRCQFKGNLDLNRILTESSQNRRLRRFCTFVSNSPPFVQRCFSSLSATFLLSVALFLTSDLGVFLVITWRPVGFLSATSHAKYPSHSVPLLSSVTELLRVAVVEDISGEGDFQIKKCSDVAMSCQDLRLLNECHRSQYSANRVSSHSLNVANIGSKDVLGEQMKIYGACIKW